MRDSPYDETVRTKNLALINMIKIEWNAYGVRELGNLLAVWEISSMKEGDGKWKKQGQQGQGGTNTTTTTTITTPTTTTGKHAGLAKRLSLIHI